MSETIWVYGYHGTSMERATSIIESGFNPSNNEYDWLGKGIYLWQDAPKELGNGHNPLTQIIQPW